MHMARKQAVLYRIQYAVELPLLVNTLISQLTVMSFNFFSLPLSYSNNRHYYRCVSAVPWYVYIRQLETELLLVNTYWIICIHMLVYYLCGSCVCSWWLSVCLWFRLTVLMSVYIAVYRLRPLFLSICLSPSLSSVPGVPRAVSLSSNTINVMLTSMIDFWELVTQGDNNI